MTPEYARGEVIKEFFKKPGGGGARLLSQHPGGGGKWISVKPRTARATQRKPVSKNNNKEFFKRQRELCSKL